MKQLWCLFLLATYLVFFSTQTLAQNIPVPANYVSDFASIFSESYVTQMSLRLAEFEKQTTHQIAVVTIKSLEGLTIEEYATRLFDQWQIGQDQKDNGLLLLIAPNDKKVRIEVGYGLEGVITDGRAGNILDTQVLPEFKNGNYEQGVRNGVDTLINFLNDPSTIPPVPNQVPSESTLTWLFILFFSGLPIYLLSYLSRSREITSGAIIGAIIGYLLSGLVLSVLLGLFGLLLDFILSRNYKKLSAHGLPSGFWHSRGGFSGGSNSGFGGFGGGRSGGGGASRGW